MLLLHILDLNGEELTVFKTVLERVAGCLGMYMNLDDLVIRYHDDAVSDGLEIQTKVVGFFFTFFITTDDELGAVGKVDDLVKLSRGGTEEIVVGFLLIRFFLQFNDYAVAENGEHTLEDGQNTLTARVDNTCLLEDREHGGGQIECLQRSVTDDLPQNSRIFFGIQRLKACLITHAGHGEDGTLGGLGDSIVSRLNAQTQRVDQIGAGRLSLTLQTLGDASEQQRGDNAGVAASAAQHSGGGHVRNLGNIGRLGILERVSRRCDRHRHIGTCIAVGYREDIEVVDSRLDGRNVIRT